MKVDRSRYLALRRDIHRHPELSNQEVETTRRIREFLAQDGLELHSIGDLNGGYVSIDAGKERTVCMRADIDALPLTEQTGAPFASVIPGVMHACGHDMHTAIAAGIACELNRVKERLNSNLVVLFQPAEEANPIGGALPVVQSGFLTKCGIQEIYGLHMWPSLPVGHIALRPGALMAASDRFQLRVLGTSAHAAEPHLGVDAIAIASEINLALVQKLRRELNPFEAVSISTGSIQSTGRYNIVCDRVVVDGTIRTTNEVSRSFVHRRVQEIAEQIALIYGGKAEVSISRGYGVLKNSPALFDQFVPTATKLLGEACVHTDINPSLIGEDFYYFSQQIPALYFHVGCQAQHPLHNNEFLPREEALGVAIDLMTEYFTTQS